MILSDDAGRGLVQAARSALHDALGAEKLEVPQAALVAETGASFVTLRQHGELRGCIGTVEPKRPLIEDVRRNAVAAATRDPRFLPLSLHELPHTRLEVTVLGIPVAFDVRDEADAIARLEPGDGVILTIDGRRGVFLPQVWDQVDDAREFLAHLKEKAGLAAHGWPDGIRLERFTVQKWCEETPVPEEAIS